MATIIYQPTSGDFKHGLFDCCDNMGDCCFAYCCGPCYAYVAANAAGNGLVCSLFQCLTYPTFLCFLRNSVRQERMIEGNLLMDIALSCFCPCCTVIQVKREFTE